MNHYRYIVQSRAAPGRLAELEDWYGSRHLADVCRVPGVERASLHRVAWQLDEKLEVPEWDLLAIYELKCDDPDQVLSAINLASHTDAMPISDALSRSDLLQTMCLQVASAASSQ